METLESAALPDTPEGLGKAIRRIVTRSPDLSLQSKSTGKERIITITLRKPSEPSEPSADDSETHGNAGFGDDSKGGAATPPEPPEDLLEDEEEL